MKKMVDIMGALEWVEIKDRKEIGKMNVRYIGTDYEAEVDIYEDQATGEFWGKLN